MSSNEISVPPLPQEGEKNEVKTLPRGLDKPLRSAYHGLDRLVLARFRGEEHGKKVEKEKAIQKLFKKAGLTEITSTIDLMNAFSDMKRGVRVEIGNLKQKLELWGLALFVGKQFPELGEAKAFFKQNQETASVEKKALTLSENLDKLLANDSHQLDDAEKRVILDYLVENKSLLQKYLFQQESAGQRTKPIEPELTPKSPDVSAADKTDEHKVVSPLPISPTIESTNLDFDRPILFPEGDEPRLAALQAERSSIPKDEEGLMNTLKGSRARTPEELAQILSYEDHQEEKAALPDLIKKLQEVQRILNEKPSLSDKSDEVADESDKAVKDIKQASAIERREARKAASDATRVPTVPNQPPQLEPFEPVAPDSSNDFFEKPSGALAQPLPPFSPPKPDDEGISPGGNRQPTTVEASNTSAERRPPFDLEQVAKNAEVAAGPDIAALQARIEAVVGASLERKSTYLPSETEASLAVLRSLLSERDELKVSAAVAKKLLKTHAPAILFTSKPEIENMELLTNMMNGITNRESGS